MAMHVQSCSTQNDLLLSNLVDFYSRNDYGNLRKMLAIINGESVISLRIIDWFSTNYAKKYYTVYSITNRDDTADRRFKVYTDYKLKLKAYSKKRFDPFCRWDRIDFPYGSSTTTNFRKKREELSILASSCIKKETVEVVVKFE